MYMNRCSTSPTSRQLYIKTAIRYYLIRYHLISVRMASIKKNEITNAGKNIEKSEHLCTNLEYKLVLPLWRQGVDSLKIKNKTI